MRSVPPNLVERTLGVLEPSRTSSGLGIKRLMGRSGRDRLSHVNPKCIGHFGGGVRLVMTHGRDEDAV